MAREYFVFNRNYYEIVKVLDGKQRLEMYDAICEFALNQNESKIEGLPNALFSLIKPDILKGLAKYKNGVKGGRGKKANGKQNESKTKANEKLTESKTKANGKQNESKEETTFPLKKTTKEKDEQKEKSKKTNTPFVQEDPPYIPPKGSGAQDKFFSVYCQFKKSASGNYPQIDFERLLKEFDKSSALRKTFSWQVILDSYDSILQGNFRDKVDGQAEGREYMAERERYYTALRTAAEKKAENIRKRFMQNERYAGIDKRLRMIPMEQGKAEAKGDKSKMAELEQESMRLRLERRGIIEINGLTEEDIEPRRTCLKCQDTGYTEDGALCDCYKGA